MSLVGGCRALPRVLTVTPTRRDGEVTRELLGQAGIECIVCPDLAALIDRLACEEVDAVVLTDAALLDTRMSALAAALARQPAWSDLPVLILARDREHSPLAARSLGLLTNVTLLDRPASTRSMVSAVQAALRARQWQYRIREQWTELERAERALREVDHRKDVFLATLAHELRNPLAPIRTGLQILSRAAAEGSTPPPVLEMMERQLAQMVRLIDDLLDLSRISTGKLVLQREPLDLCAVVSESLEASRPWIDQAGHRLQLSLPARPVWALGDPSRLAQVISNLVNNAAKYTPQPGLIEVALTVQDTQALIAVRDTGAGIPAEMLEEVFGMFTQVNKTLARAQGGLGIGLSLVRRLVELHGGTVSAASAGLDQGSTFSVSLPIVRAEPATPAVPGLPAGASRAMRVLVVDDNEDAANSLCALLDGLGHATRSAYTGTEALQCAAAFQPEVILCDIGLPGMDGHEVAARLRADSRHRGAVLIALTGWGSDEDKRRTLAAGFDHHLVKPVDLGEIETILAAL